MGEFRTHAVTTQNWEGHLGCGGERGPCPTPDSGVLAPGLGRGVPNHLAVKSSRNCIPERQSAMGDGDLLPVKGQHTNSLTPSSSVGGAAQKALESTQRGTKLTSFRARVGGAEVWAIIWEQKL